MLNKYIEWKYFKVWIAECGLTDEEWKMHCLVDLERWFGIETILRLEKQSVVWLMKNGKSIACKVGLGIWFEIKLKASDEDKLFRDKSSKVWDDWCRMKSACDEGGWRMKITGLQTCSGQIKNWNDWFADWVWPILITGLQICSGQIENWNYWFADWVWPNLHWLNGWYLKWAAKCDIWMRNKNCI